MWDKYRYALVAILILALVVRLSTLTLPGFIEDDNYVYYSVMLQTIAHGMTITDTLSGVPPIQFNEHPGLIYLAAVPAEVLKMNPYWIMKILPPIVGVAEVLLTYLIMEKLTKKKSAALIAALLVATIPGMIYKNLSGEWRGESFVPLLMGIMVYAMLWGAEDSSRTLKSMAAIAVCGAISIWIWSGGVYVIIPVVFTAIFILAYMVAGEQRALLLGTLFMVITFYLFFAIPNPYVTGAVAQNAATLTISEQVPTTLPFLLQNFGWAVIFAVIGLMIVYTAKQLTFMKKAIILSWFFLTAFFLSLEIRWVVLAAMPIAVLAAIGLQAFLEKINQQGRKIMILFAVGSTIILVIYWLATLAPYSENGGLLPAAAWLSNNTPANSTVLTLWDDGSVIEGWGHRQSFTDSMMAGQLQPEFTRFLLARAGNYSFIEKLKPDYLVVRQIWYTEKIGTEYYTQYQAIVGEGNYTGSPPTYNGSNFQQLLNGTAPFPIVYRNNDSIIYKIQK